MRRLYFFSLGFFVVTMLFFSCGGQTDFVKQSKTDSLFLGFFLGMEKQAFYDHCWEYNRRKIFTHGPTNQSVEYRMMTEFQSPVVMRFYPTFYQGRIFEMPVTLNYDAWAPWNRKYKSDSLLAEAVPLFEKWYGKFQIVDDPEMGRVYYRMDGKRRINLYIKDDQFVRLLFTDLRVEKELEKKAQESGTEQ